MENISFLFSGSEKKKKGGAFVNTVDISVGTSQIYKNHRVSGGEI